MCTGRAILLKPKNIPKLFISVILVSLIIIYTLLTNNSATNDPNIRNHQQTSYKTLRNNYKELNTQVGTFKKVHIVIQFPVLINGTQVTSIHQRQQEYIKTLELNHQHPQVEKIHILLERQEDIKFIENATVQREKIYYHSLNRRMLYRDTFGYASQFLLNKTAIIMNADCYLGDGFEKLNVDILRKGTVYALTRHETPDAVRKCGVKDFCSPQAKYIGSHDAFVMHLVTPLPSNFLDAMMVRQDIVGVEKLIIFILRVHGKFAVRNPCGVLFIYHNHCTKLRNKKQRLINGKRINKIYLANEPRWRTNAPFSAL